VSFGHNEDTSYLRGEHAVEAGHVLQAKILDKKLEKLTVVLDFILSKIILNYTFILVTSQSLFTFRLFLQ
jgi:hypothetical protein